MTKRKQRIVHYDMGYGLQECWEYGKVIDSQMCKQLFSEELRESILVERMTGERIWVDYYEEQ